MNPPTSVSVPTSPLHLSSYHRKQNRPDSNKCEGHHYGTQQRTSEVNMGRTRQLQPDEDGFIPMMSQCKRRAIGCREATVSGFEGAPPPLTHIWVSRVKPSLPSLKNNRLSFFIMRKSHMKMQSLVLLK